MADDIDWLKSHCTKNKDDNEKNRFFCKENTILIAIIVFSIFIIALDYSLIIKFINVVKNI